MNGKRESNAHTKCLKIILMEKLNWFWNGVDLSMRTNRNTRSFTMRLVAPSIAGMPFSIIFCQNFLRRKMTKICFSAIQWLPTTKKLVWKSWGLFNFLQCFFFLQMGNSAFFLRILGAISVFIAEFRIICDKIVVGSCCLLLFICISSLTLHAQSPHLHSPCNWPLLHYGYLSIAFFPSAVHRSMWPMIIGNNVQLVIGIHSESIWATCKLITRLFWILNALIHFISN